MFHRRLKVFFRLTRRNRLFYIPVVDYSTAKLESADGGVRMAAGASTHVLRDGLTAATSTSIDDDGSLSGHIKNDGPILVLGKSRSVGVLHPNEPDFAVGGPLVVPAQKVSAQNTAVSDVLVSAITTLHKEEAKHESADRGNSTKTPSSRMDPAERSTDPGRRN